MQLFTELDVILKKATISSLALPAQKIKINNEQ